MIKKLINRIFHDTKDEMSFRAAFDLTELPVITLYQGDRKFNFLLDTGSNSSIIDSNVLDKIKYETNDVKSNLFGMEGKNRIVNMCTISLYFKDREYTYDYLINDMKDAFDGIKRETGVTIHGIIGSKFFNKFKYVLDFDKLIAYSKS